MLVLIIVGILGLAHEFAIPTEPTHISTKPTHFPSEPAHIQTTNPTQEKIFVDVTPEYLMNLYEDKLSLQADKLMSPYIGKWIKVAGQIRNIAGPDFLGMMTTFRSNGLGITFMYYDEKWFDILSTIRRGQNVVALCQIFGANSTEVRLRHCELQAQSQPNEQPPMPLER